ncbi:MAG: hypothetical protein ABJG68_17505 [Crocinitomicaceae bacterium]
MKRLIYLSFIVLLVSCNSKPSLDITPEQIDDYIADCLDTSKVYDINLGPQYSRDEESYKADEYSQYDTLKMISSEEYSEKFYTSMTIFFKDGLPVYISEYISAYNAEDGDLVERHIYLNGAEIIKASERTGATEYDLDVAPWKEVELTIDNYDFERPRRAVAQEGEFEMKYKEFLIINPESYLILKNDESKYGVALYILEGDDLLDELYAKPLIYQGKILKFDYEFLNMNGIERMIYRGGEVVEKEEA